MVKTIIFDLGGVIFKENWEKLSEEFVGKFGISTLMRSQHGPEVQEEYNKALTGQKNMVHVFRKICEVNKLDRNVDELCEFNKEAYKKNKTIDNNMIELVKKLEQKYKVVCLTDTNELHFKSHKEAGILDLFDEQFASHQTGKRKKDEGAFQIILEKLNQLPEELLLIDDNIKNVENAKSIGINAIQFGNYEQLVSELKKIQVIS